MKLISRTEDTGGCLPLLLGGSAWAIRRDVLPRVLEATRNASAPVQVARAAEPDTRTSARAGGAVAVIPLTGVITPRGSFLSMLFGGAPGGLMDFREQFATAVASPDVGAIVLDVDSPGGLIDLVPETAAEILAARGSKPIVAVANTMAASAAYWIASQADELVVTPSGDVGSVGVYMVHYDCSAMNEKLGIAATYISAGQYKTEGNPDEPLSEGASADWQQEIDTLYDMFVEGVATGRGVSADTVRSGYGEGRTLLAARALTAGMVDRVDTLENVISGLLAADSSGRGGPAARAARLVLAPRTEIPAALAEPASAAADRPAHVPDDAPQIIPPADPVMPDVGPDASPETEPAAPAPAPVAPDLNARAAIAALLF